MSYPRRSSWRSYSKILFTLVLVVLSDDVAAAPATTATITTSMAPSQIASVYTLTASTSLAMPTAPLVSQGALGFIDAGWDVSKSGRVSLPEDISFVANPIDNSSDSKPVFDVWYPQGSYSLASGGTSFSTFFNGSSSTGQFQTMMISYEVGFPHNFQFAKGGELPGLRGGTLDGCDGASNSANCFTTRLMWRANGTGEAYAYIQDTAICKDPGIICNNYGFGVSIGRGKFSFNTGAWNRVDLIVGLNNPPSKSNGFVDVYHNGLLAISQTGIRIRSNSSVENIQGMFFSSFFGGSDASWATPISQNTYYRNIQLFASDSASTLASGASPSPHLSNTMRIKVLLGVFATISLLL